MQQQELEGGRDHHHGQEQGPVPLLERDVSQKKAEQGPREQAEGIRLTLPSSSGRPSTCAEKTPRQMKMLGMRPRKPRRFLGAISPR